MSRDPYVTDDLVVPSVNDSDLAVIFSGILATVADVHEFRFWFIGNTVRPKFKMDRVEQFERVSSEYAEHPVIAARQKHLVQFRNKQSSLRFFKSGNAAHPLASLQVDYLKGSIFQPRNEQALAFDIHIHVVETAFHIW